MFSMTKDQVDKLEKWCNEQDNKVKAAQAMTWGGPLTDDDLPYYGATGGGYTYMFTPTSIGEVVKVRNNLTGDQIDLTNYEEW